MAQQKISNFRPNCVGLTFSNGNKIDAVFGWGTYSDNYGGDMFIGDPIELMNKFMSSSTVESMFYCSNKLAKKIEKKFGEQPLGRIGIDDWLEIAIMIKREKR